MSWLSKWGKKAVRLLWEMEGRNWALRELSQVLPGDPLHDLTEAQRHGVMRWADRQIDKLTGG